MIEEFLTSAITTTVLAGLFAFLGNIWINRISELDRIATEGKLQKLQKQIDLQVHTDQSVFDKELECAVESWRSVLKLVVEVQYIKRDATIGVNPSEQLKKCYEQHLKTHDILYLNSPFYPEEIRDAAFDTAVTAQNIYQDAERMLHEPEKFTNILMMCEERLALLKENVECFESALRSRYVQIR